jgi:hypothetical protein
MSNKKEIENPGKEDQLKIDFTPNRCIPIMHKDSMHSNVQNGFNPRIISINSREHIYKSILNRKME